MTERRSSGAIATQTPDCTFVCCIEAGPLETMTLRLVESLRRFGGRAAQSPVIAVRPRRGPSLSRSGRRRLDELGVEVLGPPKRPRYDWYHFLNKPKALVAAEAIAQSDVIAFLDGDTLVLAEPQALWLGDDSDFAAKPEIGSIESNGPGSTYEPLWEAFASALGLSLDDLPGSLHPKPTEERATTSTAVCSRIAGAPNWRNTTCAMPRPYSTPAWLAHAVASTGSSRLPLA